MAGHQFPSPLAGEGQGGGSSPRTLVIACGALAREVLALVERHRWHHLELTCLPAKLHNRPQLIPEAVRRKIARARGRYERILVAYGDCGTGGELDRVLAEEGVERIEGPHCYAFYRGLERFQAEHDAEPACFYLTDYLVRHFETLIIKGLGLDRHPELLPLYFGNYEALVYLAQVPDAALERQAKAAAERLGLAYEHRPSGMGELEAFLSPSAPGSEPGGTRGPTGGEVLGSGPGATALVPAGS